MKSLAFAFLLLAGSSRAVSAAEPPFYIRAVNSQKDVGAINENFRSNSDAIRTSGQQISDLQASVLALQVPSTVTGFAFLQNIQTFSAANTFTGTVGLASLTTVSSTMAFTVVLPTSSTPTVNSLYANNIVKAWVDFDGTGPTILDGFNVARVVYSGSTGIFTVVWANAFASANYFVSCTDGGGADFSGGVCGIDGITGAKTAAQVTINARDDAGTRRNFTHIYVMAMGKQ